MGSGFEDEMDWMGGFFRVSSMRIRVRRGGFYFMIRADWGTELT